MNRVNMCVIVMVAFSMSAISAGDADRKGQLDLTPNPSLGSRSLTEQNEVHAARARVPGLYSPAPQQQRGAAVVGAIPENDPLLPMLAHMTGLHRAMDATLAAKILPGDRPVARVVAPQPVAQPGFIRMILGKCASRCRKLGS